MINEISGEQLDVTAISNQTVDKVIKKVIQSKEDLLDNGKHSYDFTAFESPTDEIRENTKIEYVKFYIEHR